MANDLNRAFISGRLVADPYLRYNDDKTAVLNFTVAVNEKERSDFVDCAAFGAQAEFIDKYFEKGKVIVLEGKIRTSVWEKKDGVKAKDVKLYVSEVHFG